MLSDIVEEIVRSIRAKPRWMPPNLSIDDIRQEAWVSVLEAQNEGIDDPSELLKAARRRMKDMLRAELHRAEVPYPEEWLDGGQ